MIVTALLPRIGYEKATGLIGEFFASGRENIVDFLTEKLGREVMDEMFSPRKLVALGYNEEER